MYKYFLLALILLLAIESQSKNIIRKGNPVHIDGLIGDDEWTDSFVYEICRNGFVDSKIYIKHDGENLLVAFVFSGIPDSTLVIPEIFIDSKCDQSENWQEDDFWFHVSAQDCYAVGKREDYSNCRPDYLVWRASPNYPLGENYEVFDAIECSVPFALIGIEPGQKIGLCPSLSIHPQNKRFNWPITAHEDKPSSWATFKIWE